MDFTGRLNVVGKISLRVLNGAAWIIIVIVFLFDLKEELLFIYCLKFLRFFSLTYLCDALWIF